ncbi:MAG TPA: hypothetical protein VGG06_29705, partial [Thermoanaerobaculia bacterium]
QQAEHARRTLEAELLRIVAAAAPVDEMLSPELEEAVERLSLLSDDELWQAARGVLSPEESARLESLHLVQLRDTDGTALGLLHDGILYSPGNYFNVLKGMQFNLHSSGW